MTLMHAKMAIMFMSALPRVCVYMNRWSDLGHDDDVVEDTPGSSREDDAKTASMLMSACLVCVCA